MVDPEGFEPSSEVRRTALLTSLSYSSFILSRLPRNYLGGTSPSSDATRARMGDLRDDGLRNYAKAGAKLAKAEAIVDFTLETMLLAVACSKPGLTRQVWLLGLKRRLTKNPVETISDP